MKPGRVTYSILIVLFIQAWSFMAAAEETGEILVPLLNMRSGPGKGYAVVERLEKGSRVTVTARQNGWLEVIHGDVRGYVQENADLIDLHHNASPQEPSDIEKKIKAPQQNAETIHMQMEASKKDLETKSAEEKRILDEFESLAHNLSKTREQVRVTQANMAAIDEKIAEINEQSDELEKQIGQQETYAALRLNALYKMNQLGRTDFLASADSFFDFITRQSAFERILDKDNILLEDLRNKQTTLDALLAQLNTSRTEKQILTATLQQRQAELEAQQKRHSAILDRIRSEKALETAALKSLEQAARRLDQTLVMNPVSPEPPLEHRGSASVEQKSFARSKGLLTWPVQGKIISFFGSRHSGRFNVPTFQSGINIQAERGEPVRAVAEGYTIFSSWFNGFGNMIIIDHGDHYYTVYAHLEERFKVKGDWVEKGEVIATVGDSGSLSGPALHFEVRHRGTPADPLLWIKNG